jgi:hypothetical protein
MVPTGWKRLDSSSSRGLLQFHFADVRVSFLDVSVEWGGQAYSPDSCRSGLTAVEVALCGVGGDKPKAEGGDKPKALTAVEAA